MVEETALEIMGHLRGRSYGSSGHYVIVMHGGPAAAGNAGPLAEGLADRFRVLEPWQRGSGSETLSVASHIADLHELIRARCDGPVAIVGESWGAMLTLAFAAAHPDVAAALVLVGCGTFDPATRGVMRAKIAERSGDPSPYDYAPILSVAEQRARMAFDKQAYDESWQDMLRLQAEGVYPAAFAAIKTPVVMIHGDHDPHPGCMIRDTLAALMPQLEYVELARCGHSPWNERHAREPFFEVLKAALDRSIAPRA